MQRREFLAALGAAALIPFADRRLLAFGQDGSPPTCHGPGFAGPRDAINAASITGADHGYLEMVQRLYPTQYETLSGALVQDPGHRRGHRAGAARPGCGRPGHGDDT